MFLVILDLKCTNNSNSIKNTVHVYRRGGALDCVGFVRSSNYLDDQQFIKWVKTS